MSRATVVIELESNTQSARDLAAGGVYVPGCGLRLAEECELVVCGANDQLHLPARVVYVDEHRGAGLEVVGFSLEMKARIAELAPVDVDDLGAPGEPRLEESEPDRSSLDDIEPGRRPPSDDDRDSRPLSAVMIDLEPLDDDLAVPVAAEAAEAAEADEAVEPCDTFDPDDTFREALELDFVDGVASADDTEPDDDLAAPNTDAFDTLQPDQVAGPDAYPDELIDHARGSRPIARNVHERLRGLNQAAQIKMATSGELHERIVLERLYGKNVWETLLRNPRLSAPEVSRIARYGALPRVLLEIIVGNNAWLQVPEVRRALLSNPRLATDQIMKVLRLMPRHELRLAAIQTVYPHAVRNVARMLLREAER